ncbi:MAG: hypothetical protein WC217_03720 [Candidatus Paceibacterota bacterium]|jgi:hypothetical protein
MKRHFTAALALLLAVTLFAPSLFLIAPQKAQAQYSVIEVGKQLLETTITAIKSTLSEIHNATTAAATYAEYINTYYLQPLAFVLSGNLLKALTAGVIAFVIGKSNGTGVPQFATDVLGSLQTVSDSQALAYLNSFGRNSNSPFASSISSSLRTNYLQKTSLAGFWAANRSTLSRYSPNVNAYLAGNWSQGGIASWFALTTQNQNNPYTLYPTTQSELATLVGPGIGGVTGTRLAQLSWGQGFMSWCGATDEATQAQNSAATDYQQCQASGKTGAECQAVFDSAGGTMPSSGGINPGDACTTKDGTPGVLKTPGSTIKATLDKVLGGQQDQIVRMGNVGPQINAILGNIATVMQTVNFASQILGGPNSGGLFGVGQVSSSNSTSRLMEYQNAPGNLGVTNTTINRDTAKLPVAGGDVSNRVTQYQSAWGTIGSAANTASTTVADLASYCIAQQKVAKSVLAEDPSALATFIRASTAQADAATTTLTIQIAPVLAKVAAADGVIATARAAVAKVQGQLSDTGTSGGTYSTEIQSLQTMPPTMTDVANVQQEAEAFNLATANPIGSLTVSDGSILDQMNLITKNATTLKSTVCTPASSSSNTQFY